MRDDVLAIVSHDLRTPLNAIAMGADMLISDSGSETRASGLDSKPAEIIRRSALHMRALVEELLELASIQAGGLVLERAPVSLSELVDDVFAMLSPAAFGQAARPAAHAARCLHGVLRPRQSHPNFVQSRRERHQVQPSRGADSRHCAAYRRRAAGERL